ncbi:MAG: sugar transferase, partial [Bacillota bacterium]
MHSSNKLAFTSIGQFILDILFLILSYIIAYIIASNIRELHGIQEYVWVLLLYVPLWISTMGALG